MEDSSVQNQEQNSENPAVANFKEYLRIPSVHPDINYDDCVEFIKRQARELGLLWMVYSCAPGNPVVILTWTGQQPELPSLLLNSHMDVVPAYPEKWTHDPFGAEEDEEGNIYGRGAQDMKSIGIQYIEAIRRLKQNGVLLKRTVHVSFVPDEEKGSNGMCKFVNTPEFRSLNVGCSLDEARSCPEDAFYVYYGERTIWRPVVTCRGETGHGSAMVRDSAAAKARVIVDRLRHVCLSGPVVTCRGETGHRSAMVRDSAAAKARVIVDRLRHMCLSGLVVTCRGETGHGSALVRDSAAAKARVIVDRLRHVCVTGPVVTCRGETGHGSALVRDSAAAKARVIVNRFLDWRQREQDKLDADPQLTLSDVTTVNLTMLSGGVQMNVVPAEIKLGFDIRLSNDNDFQGVSRMVEGFCQEAGEGTTVEYEAKDPIVTPTSLGDDNPWWAAFRGAADQMGVKLKPIITPGGTDSRYLRKLGISAFGFSPMNNTPTLLHDNDEYLNVKTFLRGIDVYYELIQALANH